MPNKGYKQTKEHIEKLRLIRTGRILSNRTNIFINCWQCKSVFRIKPCHLKSKKYCSQKCYSFSKIGKPTWSKGIKMTPECKVKISNKLKGKHTSPNTEFKKGDIPHNYNGGITIKEGGYVMKKIKNHPSLGKFGYIKNSRLVIEKHIGRFLNRHEIVHHINKIKNDDRISNLMVFNSNSAHIRYEFNPTNVKEQEIVFDGSKLNIQESTA